MKRKRSRLLPILLCLCMVVAFAPAAAYGNGDSAAINPDSFGALAEYDNPLKEIDVTDPFIVADKRTQTYFMYAVNPNVGQPGVIVYQSKDLANWSDPQVAYNVPADSWNGQEAVMTPEVSLYEGKYYLFVTLQNRNGGVVPRALNDRLHTTYHRSVVVAVADTLAGPFVDIDKTAPITGDLRYMHRDGTLYVDPDGAPYLIYAHDWTQKIDGNFQAIALNKNDLSKKAADQFLLFRASLASFYADAEYEGSPGYKQANSDAFAPYKAFNPQIYNTPEGGLAMLWGTEREGKLVVSQAVSKTGSLNGPWVQKAIILRDGRSTAMSFTAFDGTAMILCRNADGKAELYDATITDDGFKLGAHRADLDGLTMSVADTLAPRIFPPSTRLVETADASAAVPFKATAYDNVDGWIDVQYSTAPGSTFVKGTHNVTVTATDAAGNSSNAVFKVIVSDPIPEETPGPYTSAISTASGYPLKLPQMGIHDPYIYYDPVTEHYILHQGTGRNVWKSQDLTNWAGPIQAFTIVGRSSGDNLGTNYETWLNATYTPALPWNRTSGNWAAEMFSYKGKYYFFTTLHNDWAKPKLSSPTDESSYVLPSVQWRASIIAEGTSPEGPFTNMHYAAPVTPRDFMTLDATLYVDHDGTPWLVYAHEWVQKMDGTMEAIPLTNDLTAAAGEPVLMFRASAAPWYEYQKYQNQPQYAASGGAKYTTVATTKELSNKQCTQYVTDGPHVWETADGSLVCLFTTYRDDEYIQSQFISRTGNIMGPWEPAPYLDFDDKGHAMIFEDKEGGMKLVMHNNMGGVSDKTLVMNAQGQIAGNQQGVRAEISDVVLTNDGFRIVDHREDLDGQVNVTSYEDTLAPLIYAPADRYASVSSGENAKAVSFNAYAMDDKDGWNYRNPDDVTLTYSHLPGSVFPVGATEVTLTAEDSKGNVSTKTFTVNVIDKTDLNLKINAALAVDPDASDAAAYAVLSEKLFDAQEVFDARYISQESVDAVTNQLAMALSRLSLQSAYDEISDQVDGLNPLYYTQKSWEALEDALAYAADVLADAAAEQDEVDYAQELLLESFGKLMILPVIALLQSAVSDADAIVAAPGYVDDYPLAKRTALEAALTTAKNVLAHPENYTSTGMTSAWNALRNAIIALQEPANTPKTELAWWIGHAEALLAAPPAANYIPAAKENLQDAIDAAKLVYNNALSTDAQFIAEAEKIQEAIWQLYDKGDKTELQQLYDIVKGYDESIYTPASWTVFKAALDAAKDTLDNVNAIEEDVVEAYQNLVAGEAQLALKTIVDFTALNAAIAAAQKILDAKDNYIASSIVGLQGLVTNARALLTKPGVTQAEVNAATDALRQAIAKARLKPDRSPLLSALALAQGLSLNDFTASSVAPLTALVSQGNELITQPDEALTQTQINALAQQILDAISALVARTSPAPQPANTDPGNAGGTSVRSDADESASVTAGDSAAPGTGIADNSAVGNPESNAAIDDGLTPVSAPDAQGGISGALLAAIIALGALLAAAIGFIIFLIWKRRKKEEEAEATIA